MRISSNLLSIPLFLGLSVSSAADEIYTTATGEIVRTLDVFQDCDACPEMIVLPLGTFDMGSSVAEANAARIRLFDNQNLDHSEYDKKLRQSFSNLGINPDQPEEGLRQYYASGQINLQEDPGYTVNPFLHEVPRHRVSIDRAIAMGRNEVTREEWDACVKDGGCEPRPGSKRPDDRIRFRLPNGPRPTHPRSPRTGITYYEMSDYASWLNTKIGADVYRVPTESEWEYAARSGTTTRFAQGDTLTLEQANFLVYRHELVDGEYVWNYDLGSPRQLLPVDDLDSANAWGLRHMSGNASEFTSTCGAGPHRGLATSSLYLAANSDRSDCKRYVKGGMYIGNVELARPARRVAIASKHWSPSLGFRVVRDLVPEPDN